MSIKRAISIIKMEKPDVLMQIDNLSSETNLCTSCLEENDYGAVYCRRCNSALSLTENHDPLQKLGHEGAVYSKAVEGKPRLVVLVSVWLLFFPVLILSAASAVSLAFEGEAGSLSFVLFWVSTVAAFFSLVMIYKVTKNFFKSEKKDSF